MIVGTCVFYRKYSTFMYNVTCISTIIEFFFFILLKSKLSNNYFSYIECIYTVAKWSEKFSVGITCQSHFQVISDVLYDLNQINRGVIFDW